MSSRIAILLLAGLAVPISASQGRRGAPVAQGPTPSVLLTKTTPLFSCGQDAVVPMSTAVSWQTIALAADRRLYVPCPAGGHDERHQERRDAQVLDDAMRSPVAEFRRAAVAAYGRLGRPEFVGVPGGPAVLVRALDDAEPTVRREAASAIADALAGGVIEPDDSGPHPASPEIIEFARASLESHLAAERDDDVAGMYLETIGRLKYSNDASKESVENLLVISLSSGSSMRVLGAAKGLESLTRLSPRRPLQQSTIEQLRALVVSPSAQTRVPATLANGSEVPSDVARLARARRLAMQALVTIRDDHPATLSQAAVDTDWQVRRLVVMRLDPAKPELAPIRALFLVDKALQVRYELAGYDAKEAIATGSCSALRSAFNDASVIVALHAIELVPRGCRDAELIERDLMAMASALPTRTIPESDWQKPARALATMMRLNPERVSSQLMEAATTDPIWQVRATVAAIAGQQKNYPLLLRLAKAGPANVSTAAIEAMGTAKSDDIVTAQIAALSAPDFQLVRAGAVALRGTPAARREEASYALLNALATLTKQGFDTSRDPRVAILQRLQEIMPPELGMRLLEYFDDFDPKVRAAAQAAHRALIGGTTGPTSRLVHRYPVQPTEEQLAAFPSRAILQIAGLGAITIELLPREAPITVARFVDLARGGYYNGLTFHRVVPNFVVQGGSPGASEYVGNPRFWRDEVGTVPHTRGAVGISTRGHDTGDGQIFIDLVDLPRLDHDYSVFARVTSGLDVVDKILEGARIVSVTVR